MEDLTYLLKILITVLNILLCIEISIYLFVNRNRAFKGDKRDHPVSEASTRINKALSSFFLLLAISLAIHCMKVRWWYFFPSEPTMFFGYLDFFFISIAIGCFIILSGPVFGITGIKTRWTAIVSFTAIPFISFVLPAIVKPLTQAILMLSIFPVVLFSNFFTLTVQKRRAQFKAIVAG
nr:hypothetical protein [Candidatus Sigynarchaeota archaeon]